MGALPGHAQRRALPFQPSSSATPRHGDMAPLLQACFQRACSAGEHGQVLLSGHVTHYQTDNSDFGWGCGWRNIQMLVSHLIQSRAEFRGALFGGCGFVPDIPTLQDWLEHAWRSGFDPEGCAQLGGHVKGTQTWIGATDAATLLRFCNVRALVVDFQLLGAAGAGSATRYVCDGCRRPISGTRFHSLATDDFDLCALCRQRPSAEEHAPFQAMRLPVGDAGGAATAGPGITRGGGGRHAGVQCDGCGVLPIAGTRYKSLTIDNYDLCSACHLGPAGSGGSFQSLEPPSTGGGGGTGTNGAKPQHTELLLWVWRYFSGEPLAGMSGSAEPEPKRPRPAAGSGAFAALRPSVGGRARVTGKPPLFFQHQGHSRTIVGIERRGTLDGAKEYSLVVLDPAVPTGRLAGELAKGAESKGARRWAGTLKFGLDQLAQEEYQIMYVDTESLVASTAEYRALRTVACAQRVLS